MGGTLGTILYRRTFRHEYAEVRFGKSILLNVCLERLLMYVSIHYIYMRTFSI